MRGFRMHRLEPWWWTAVTWQCVTYDWATLRTLSESHFCCG